MDIRGFKKASRLSWDEMLKLVNATDGGIMLLATLQSHAYGYREPDLSTATRYMAAFPGVTIEGLAKKGKKA